MDFLAETQFLAELAAEQMTNRVRVRRGTGQKLTDHTTGVVTETTTVVYGAAAGGDVAKVTSGSQAAANENDTAGQHGVSMTARIDFPIRAQCQTGDVVEVLSSARDPDLVGLRFELIRLDIGERRTADRWSAELVTR